MPFPSEGRPEPQGHGEQSCAEHIRDESHQSQGKRGTAPETRSCEKPVGWLVLGYLEGTSLASTLICDL